MNKENLSPWLNRAVSLMLSWMILGALFQDSNAEAGILPPSNAAWRTLTCRGDGITIQLDKLASTVTIETQETGLKTLLSGLFCQNTTDADPRIVSCWLSDSSDTDVVFSSRLAAGFLNAAAYFAIEIRSPEVMKISQAHQMQKWHLFRNGGRTEDVANQACPLDNCEIK